MKKTLSKIKVSLATAWIAIISFSSKVFGQRFNNSMWHMQTFYWVEMPEKYISPEPLTSTGWTTSIIIKIAQILLVAIIFIVWIISFIKIKKIDDKALKKKKIKNTIIIMILLIIAAFLITKLLIRILTPIPIAYKI